MRIKDSREFEYQEDPNYKGVVRSKPVEHFKIIKVIIFKNFNLAKFHSRDYLS